MHGDLLYFEGLYREVLAGRPLSQFQLPVAPFLFPDFLLFFNLRLLTSHITWGLMLYAFAFSGILFYVAFRIFKNIWSEHRSDWHFLVAVFAYVVLADSTPYFVTAAFWPNHHGALQLFFLLGVWLLTEVKKLKSKQEFLLLWVSLLFSVGLGFSDFWAVPQVIAPLILALIYTSEKRDFSRVLTQRSLIVLLCGTGIGVITSFTLTHLNFSRREKLNFFGANLKEFSEGLFALPEILLQILLQNWIVFSVLGVFAIYVQFYKRRAQPSIGSRAWQKNFLLLGLFSVVSSIAVLLALGRIGDINLQMYLQPLIYLPVLWIVLWGIPALTISSRQAALIFFLLLIPLILNVAAYEVDATLTDYPEFVKCLDGKTLPTPWGLSDFSTASLATFTSRNELHLNPVKENLSRHYRMNSPTWFVEDIYGRKIDRHTYFIPFNDESRAAAFSLWGNPASTFECLVDSSRAITVMVYPDGIRPAP